jgi:hypothetical protein
MDLCFFFKVDLGRIQTFSKEGANRGAHTQMFPFFKVFRQNGNLPPPADC